MYINVDFDVPARVLVSNSSFLSVDVVTSVVLNDVLLESVFCLFVADPKRADMSLGLVNLKKFFASNANLFDGGRTISSSCVRSKSVAIGQ